MTIKDKRAAVVEAAKVWATVGVDATGHLRASVRELEAAETPMKLEGVLHTSFHGDDTGGTPRVDLRGHLVAGPGASQPIVSVTISHSDGVVAAFRRGSGLHRFRIVLTEIMGDES